MSIWRYTRDIENIKIELERVEKKINEKQDDFQTSTKRGDEVQARRDRRYQLQLEEKMRLLIRELILAERRLEKLKKEEEYPPS